MAMAISLINRPPLDQYQKIILLSNQSFPNFQLGTMIAKKLMEGIMIKLIYFLICSFFCHVASAQNIGLGSGLQSQPLGSAPNAPLSPSYLPTPSLNRTTIENRGNAFPQTDHLQRSQETNLTGGGGTNTGIGSGFNKIFNDMDSWPESP
jgi:hypothetical protein